MEPVRQPQASLDHHLKLVLQNALRERSEIRSIVSPAFPVRSTTRSDGSYRERDNASVLRRSPQPMEGDPRSDVFRTALASSRAQHATRLHGGLGRCLVAVRIGNDPSHAFGEIV